MITISGELGTLRYGYFVAALLGKWSVKRGRLTAALAAQNAVYITRRPLSLELVLGRTRYHWPDVNAQIVGSTLIINGLGSPEESHAESIRHAGDRAAGPQ